MSIRRLKILLLVFFVALAVPTAIMVYQAYGQLRWEAFHQHQLLARELGLRIDAGFEDIIRREQGRPFSDYNAYIIPDHDKSGIPGLLGHFQVDKSGRLQAPTVPVNEDAASRLKTDELRQRLEQQNTIGQVLSQNRLVKKQLPTTPIGALSDEIVAEQAMEPMPEAPFLEEEEAGISAFDSLSNLRGQSAEKSKTSRSADSVANLELDDRYEVAAIEAQQQEKKESKRLGPKLRSDSLQALESTSSLISKQQVPRIRAFESEIEPLEFSLLDSGHFVLFRRVWHEGERYVQGLLFDQNRFIEDLIARPFYESGVANISDLILSHQGDVVRLVSSGDSRDYGTSRIKGSELLYQTRLVSPFSELELIFSLTRLPLAAGNSIVIWSALMLGLVLLAGTFMLYRLGARQIQLAEQQQDFVSAVSHELKTPLTSIRMYGEMLREGWADETRKKSYYDFIFFESERLSRLINNVLQLARMTRRDDKPQLSKIEVGRLLDELTPRLESQLQQAGFQLQIDCSKDFRQIELNLDCDWFTQIMINLVDNAIKFSSDAENKMVQLGCQLQQQRLIFSVRDYGPGIAGDQMKKIFKLFYRSENEMTRETVGTGIGLALVQRLVSGMGGKIDVVNRQPGAEFRVEFGAVSGD